MSGQTPVQNFCITLGRLDDDLDDDLSDDLLWHTPLRLNAGTSRGTLRNAPNRNTTMKKYPPLWLVVTCAGACAAGPADSGDDQASGADASAAVDTANAIDMAVADAPSTAPDTASAGADTPSAAPDTPATDTAPPSDSVVTAAPIKLCVDDGDCDSADKCAGKWTCNKTLTLWSCRREPGSEVVCDSAAGSVCSIHACNPQTGACQSTPRPDGTPCVDEDPCTVDSACKAGKCAQKGSASWCQCHNLADCKAFDDANPCTGTLYCDLTVFPYACKTNPGTIVTCPDNADSGCSKNVCDPAKATCVMTPVKDGSACEDGDQTTFGDLCKDGACVPGIETAPCVKDADCAGDGDACNGTAYCLKAVKKCVVNNPATVQFCATNNDTDCLASTCIAATGVCALTPRNQDKACSDGDPCTASETCDKGVCAATKDLCACATDTDCVAKDDGNKCNGGLFCDKASKRCEPDYTTVVVCPAGADTACSKNSCAPLSGTCTATAVENSKLLPCTSVSGDVPSCRWQVRGANEPPAKGVLCNDGNACTSGETCDKGACQGGTKVCECTSDNDCLGKDDGNFCNGVYFCDKSDKGGVCTFNPGSAVTCPPLPGAPCWENACEAKTGACKARHRTDGTGCDDGQICSVKDACASGECSGKPNPCDDGKQCTQDKCEKDVGCAHPPRCADGNSCTLDVCNEATGECTFASSPQDGKPCDADQDGCTFKDACSKGSCTAGNKVVCKIPLDACEAAQCVSGSPTTFQCIAVPAKDGSMCDDGDGCTVGDACKSGKCETGKQERFFVVLQPGDGKRHLDYTGAMATTDGGAAVLGVLATPDDGGKPGERTWVVRFVDAAGAITAERTVDAGADPSVRPAAGRALTQGRVLVVGTRASGGKLSAWMIGVAQVGATPWLQKQLDSAVVVVADASVRSDGLLAVSGTTGPAASGQPWLVVSTSAGSVVSKVVIPTKTAASVHAHVGVQGGTLLAGEIDKDAVRHPYVAHVDGTKVAWEATLDSAGSRAMGVAPFATGYLLVGDRKDKGAATGWFGAIGQDGKLLATEVSTAFTAMGGVLSSNAGPMVFGQAADGLAVWGTPSVFGLAQDQQKGPKATMLGRAVGLSDGAVLAVGTRDDGKNLRSGVLVRTTPWGQISCQGAGTCADKKAADCADASPCTIDRCDLQGCFTLPLSAPCDDGDACTGGDACTDGKCVPGKLVNCDDADPCTVDTCHATLGCGSKNGGAELACDDGNACTEKDSCATGLCAGSARSCNDGNKCTIDACDTKKGCSHAQSDAACDDGDPCTDDRCAVQTGACNHTKNTAPCDDGFACSVGARCKDGKCLAGTKDGKLWHGEYGSMATGSAQLAALLADGEGGWYAAGWTRPSGGYWAVTARIDATGKALWQKYVGNAHIDKQGLETVSGIAATPDGPVFCGLTDRNTNGKFDGMMVALRPDGAQRWAHRYATANYERLDDCIATDDGIAAVGLADGAGKNNDGWLLLTTRAGFQLDYLRYGGPMEIV